MAREAGAERIPAHPGLGFGISGRDDRDEVSGGESVSDHTLDDDGLSINVHFAI